MDCKKFHDRFIFLYVDDEMGQDMLVSFKQHMADCPECAQDARDTQNFLMIVRKRCTRASAPRALRERILAGLSHRRGGVS